MPMLFSNRTLRILTPLALGALGGFAYWYVVGCATGSCPLTSRWWTSTLYGLLVGATFLLPGTSSGRAKPGSDEHLPPS